MPKIFLSGSRAAAKARQATVHPPHTVISEMLAQSPSVSPPHSTCLGIPPELDFMEVDDEKQEEDYSYLEDLDVAALGMNARFAAWQTSYTEMSLQTNCALSFSAR
jgi:hypothetical protein